MTPLKKCLACGDEWITDQYEVTCLVTKEPTILVTIDENPIEEDEYVIPNACPAGRHPYQENYYEYKRKSGRIERFCKACRKERNLLAVKKYQQKKTSLT